MTDKEIDEFFTRLEDTQIMGHYGERTIHVRADLLVDRANMRAIFRQMRAMRKREIERQKNGKNH